MTSPDRTNEDLVSTPVGGDRFEAPWPRTCLPLTTTRFNIFAGVDVPFLALRFCRVLRFAHRGEICCAMMVGLFLFAVYSGSPNSVADNPTALYVILI